MNRFAAFTQTNQRKPLQLDSDSDSDDEPASSTQPRPATVQPQRKQRTQRTFLPPGASGTIRTGDRPQQSSR